MTDRAGDEGVGGAIGVRWGWTLKQGLRWGLAWVIATWALHSGWALEGWPAL